MSGNTIILNIEDIVPAWDMYMLSLNTKYPGEKKLKVFEFVELWYFTPDSCVSMSLENKSSSSSSYVFNKDTPGSLSLKSMVSSWPSHKALHDHDLSWKQFDLGKNNFLLHISKMEWLAEHQASLAIFFMSIISHES
ncbi:hypothetical protein PAXRUDRAFT_20096 [Paxillus rubicundulus Ve08.2h10]|uniref:Uncharacterized protein n=1 Tax=Paxillus rubicundulus Ve08.2h10 TaxID=930991 RepID=A0A0D0CT79_9AGAM|nr:hypothetical protein PAXRUDRAFT_20096 [Paxillus rubicundulus Ve08.2h10]